MFQDFGYKIRKPGKSGKAATTARQFVSRRHPPITMHKPADGGVMPPRAMKSVLKKLQEWKLV